MAFFKRGKDQDDSGSKRGSLPPPPPPPPVDPYFGDIELRTAAEAFMSGSWQQADTLIEARGQDGWTEPRLHTAAAESPETVDAWVAAARSSRSLSCKGAVLIAQAWEARGTGMASTVTPEGFRTFRTALQKAEETLLDAALLDDTNATPWALLGPVAKGLSKSKEEKQKLFEEAHNRSPFQTYATTGMCQTLASKWGGSDEELLEFGRWVEANAPEGHPSRAALPIAYYENSVMAGMAARKAAAPGEKTYGGREYLDAGSEELAASLVRVLNAIPEVAAPAMVNTLNYHFFVASLKDKNVLPHLQRLLKALNNRNIDHPWGNAAQSPEVQFQNKQQRAFRAIDRF